MRVFAATQDLFELAMKPFHKPLYLTMLRIHWVAIGLIVVLQLIGMFIDKQVSKGEAISFFLLLILGGMAPLVPRIDSGPLRFLSAVCELLICLVASHLGIHRLYPFLSAIIVARYSMLLDITPSIALAALAAFLNNRYLASIIRKVEFAWLGPIDNQPRLDLLTDVAASILFTAALLLLVTAVRYLSIEQESRKKAQVLTLEIKDLATELERSRLAREIHDSLGHSLTALNMQLEVFATLQKSDPSRALEAFYTARRLATDILDDVRAVVHSIRHQDFQFEAAMTKLVEQTRAIKGTESEIEIELSLLASSLPQAIAYQLYNIARECLTNSVKHSDADKLTIVVREEAGSIKLDYTDNGCGFDYAERSADQNRGYGIIGMIERAESLRGTLVLESGTGKGTKISVTVPANQ